MRRTATTLRDRSHGSLTRRWRGILPALALAAAEIPSGAQTHRVERFSVYEESFDSRIRHANPYVDGSATVELVPPNQATALRLPLFWDGGQTWRFRFSPAEFGVWRWRVTSSDPGLNGRTGTFEAVASSRKGSIRPMPGFPTHFERQDGSPFWFLGDTAWALFTDNASERHDRERALRYLDKRASEKFNILHSMLLSEAGWGNSGGLPFDSMEAETLNPGYWQEVDRRVVHLNSRGMVVGLALAWGDKRKVEPFAWRRFPSGEARQRYARYVAARYGAYDVYFIVSGEWHAEIRTNAGATGEGVRGMFNSLGETLRAADQHGRMIAIHPMTEHGSAREFNSTTWMSFGDYQQNYRDLHVRLLQSLAYRKPVVNAEYGYFLRDQDGDGTPDKDNSTSLDAIRHATWDIVMAGGYAITGFGTTYFGGNRDPGPFDTEAGKNRPWELQAGFVRRLFQELEWWKLSPADELLTSSDARDADGRHLGRIAPPETTYWCLAEPGRQYALYARGMSLPLQLAVPASAAGLRARLFNPRTGEFTSVHFEVTGGKLRWRPPDVEDWAVILN